MLLLNNRELTFEWSPGVPNLNHVDDPNPYGLGIEHPPAPLVPIAPPSTELILPVLFPDMINQTDDDQGADNNDTDMSVINTTTTLMVCNDTPACYIIMKDAEYLPPTNNTTLDGIEHLSNTDPFEDMIQHLMIHQFLMTLITRMKKMMRREMVTICTTAK